MGNLDRWIEELRTTTLPQGRGQLKDDVGYCCLGIAEKLRGLTDHDMGSRCTPDQGLYDWLGVMTTSMDLELDWPVELMPKDMSPGRGGITATWLNDWAYLSFSQIADCLEYFGVKEVARAYA